MSTTRTALTVHLMIPGGCCDASFARELKGKFSIDHATIQIETAAAARCELEPDHLV